ncbi:hypothetical protein MP638_000677 [Amoeboaphelidium occidentale]|nr:hypothetical protein MP638_000677 [Amoeboaphelidium occidentale]
MSTRSTRRTTAATSRSSAETEDTGTIDISSKRKGGRKPKKIVDTEPFYSPKKRETKGDEVPLLDMPQEDEEYVLSDKNELSEQPAKNDHVVQKAQSGYLGLALTVTSIIAYLGLVYLYLEKAPSWALLYPILGFSVYVLWTPFQLVRETLSVRVILKWIRVLLALICVYFVVDFTFGTLFNSANLDQVHFTRVAFQSLVTDAPKTHVEVMVTLRYPIITEVQFYYRDLQNSEWIRSEAVSLNPDNDYTGTVKLKLEPGTDYEYAWVRSINGFIELLKFHESGVLPSHSNQVLTQQSKDRFQFKTFPDRSTGNEEFEFLFGSCIKPNFPYSAGGITGFREFNKHAKDFTLLLGDTIYVDVNFVLGKKLSDYRRLYKEVFAYKESIELIQNNTIMAMFDDHEILNDWRWKQIDPYYPATTAFSDYFPSPATASRKGPGNWDKFYYSFNYGNASFFVADTRSHRNPFKEGTNTEYDSYADKGRTMLGKGQLDELYKWLLKSRHSGIKFIVFSVPFTFNFWNKDTYYGYQAERQEILNFISDNEINNVFILSGDRHQVAVVDFMYESTRGSGVFNEEGEGVRKVTESVATEFSVSPINQFYLPSKLAYKDHNYKNLVLPSSVLEDEFKRPNKAGNWVEDKTLFYEADIDNTVVGKISVKRADECEGRLSILFCAYLPDVPKNRHKNVRKLCKEEGVVLYELLRCLS